MFDTAAQLFEGDDIRFGPMDHEGRRWDMLLMGILREEWMEQHMESHQ